MSTSESSLFVSFVLGEGSSRSGLCTSDLSVLIVSTFHMWPFWKTIFFLLHMYSQMASVWIINTSHISLL